MELPWSWRGSEACYEEWAVVWEGSTGSAPRSSHRDRNTSQRDLFVALAMRLKLIVGEILGFPGSSQKELCSVPGQW